MLKNLMSGKMINRKRKYFAGIGSRETPEKVLDRIVAISSYLCQFQNYILRSGGAASADTAFEKGAGDKNEIYLPWRGFNGNKSLLYEVEDDELELASKYHPVWDKLATSVKLFHGRNMYQILGKSLDSPVNFVVCYTKDGKASGGTGQAMRLAQDRKIVIFNLFYKEDWDFIKECIMNNKDFI